MMNKILPVSLAITVSSRLSGHYQENSSHSFVVHNAPFLFNKFLQGSTSASAQNTAHCSMHYVLVNLFRKVHHRIENLLSGANLLSAGNLLRPRVSLNRWLSSMR